MGESDLFALMPAAEKPAAPDTIRFPMGMVAMLVEMPDGTMVEKGKAKALHYDIDPTHVEQLIEHPAGTLVYLTEQLPKVGGHEILTTWSLDQCLLAVDRKVPFVSKEEQLMALRHEVYRDACRIETWKDPWQEWSTQCLGMLMAAAGILYERDSVSILEDPTFDAICHELAERGTLAWDGPGLSPLNLEDLRAGTAANWQHWAAVHHQNATEILNYLAEHAEPPSTGGERGEIREDLGPDGAGHPGAAGADNPLGELLG